jgi:hypothetical protein
MSYETPKTDKVAAREPQLPGEQAVIGETGRQIAYTDPALNMESNEFTAAGETCSACHQKIASHEASRRHLDGTFQHEMCPEHLG